MKFRRNLSSRLYRSPEPGEDGSTAIASPDAGTADPQVTANAGDAADTPALPASTHDAMFGPAPTESEAAEAAATGKTVAQLRDERGRFAGKAPTEGQQQPGAQAGKKPTPADLTAMPEGLSPKGQERFQALANSNKELTAQLAHITQAAGSVEMARSMIDSSLALQATFRENGVKREQFDLAMEVVGLMNRGDLRGALAAIDEQRRLISLHMGVALPGADALAGFPDLRQAVDNLTITEEHAIELARGRTVQHHQQQANQQFQREQQTEQQAAQAHKSGVLAVDAICKRLQQSDLDFESIEPMLLKEIQGGLLEGIPPQKWAALIEKTYGLIKQTAGTVRSRGPSTTTLRPTGGESPRQAPKTTFEAMFGQKV